MDKAKLKNKLLSLAFLESKDKDKRLATIKSGGFKAFVFTYFPHQINYITKETSDFRNFVYKNIDKLDDKYLLFKVYRGGAKTTLLGRLYVLYSLLTHKKSYCIYVSSTLDIASESIAMMKNELEDNALLIHDFDIVIGNEWMRDSISFSVDKQPKKIKAFGAGKKIRGTNYLGKRPDLIICDDIENDENVESKAQRDKLFDWFNKAILKLVARTNKDYLYLVIGTILHSDSLLNRLSQSLFKTYDFPLVKKFPSNIDSINPKNIKENDIKDMLLDDESLDKIAILKEYFTNKESFYSEYQNKPLNTTNAIFSNFQLAELGSYDFVYIGIDPALGKAKGDYFAVAEIFRNDKNKFFLRARGYKLNPSKMIDVILDIYISHLKNGVGIKLAIETIAFQEFFKDKLKEKALNRGIILSVVELKNKIAKELRIDSLAPYINDGTIKVVPDCTLLEDELLTYPKSAHDDLLDASEMAFRLAYTSHRMDYNALNKVMKNKTFRRKFL